MADETRVELVQGEIAAVELRPGDRLVVVLDRIASDHELKRIAHMLHQWAPGVPALVMEGGAQLGVVRAAGDSGAGGG